ncbi:hypothetical protein ACJX0J_011350, partial [Zea mays]
KLELSFMWDWSNFFTIFSNLAHSIGNGVLYGDIYDLMSTDRTFGVSVPDSLAIRT